MNPREEVLRPARRRFLRDAALLAGGLVIGFRLPEKGGRAWAAEEAAAGAAKVYPPNAFIRIAADDSVTLIVNKSEMGQGVYTSLPMLINEELDAPWERIRVEAAAVAAALGFAGGAIAALAAPWIYARRKHLS